MNKTPQLLKERIELIDTYFNAGDKGGAGFAHLNDRDRRLIKDFHTTTISLLLTSLKEEIENELEIQKKVQEKAKEVVAIGRARVAGMVADKYTRIGKIEALSDISILLSETISSLKVNL